MTNQFLDAMNSRFACKKFDGSKKISEDDFSEILEMGRLSPSSFGFEPWKFLVIQDSELREKMKAFTWGASGQLPTASHYVVILARKKSGVINGSSYTDYMMSDIHKMPDEVKELVGSFYKKFQEEDFKLLESDRTIFDWSSKQTYIAMANMMTGASYMGIDSCPIEGFDIGKMEKFLNDELKVDTNEFGASVAVAFGYRIDEPHREKSRQPLEDIVAWY